MTWTRGVLAVLAIAAVGYVAARPDDKAEYLGDFPSIFESAEQAPGPAPVEPPPASPDTQSTVQPPVVTSPEAPAGGGYTGGIRGNPGPGADTALPFSPPGFEGDNAGQPSGPGLPQFPPPPFCADEFFQAGVGLISCLTGEILEPDLPVELPVDPPIDVPIEAPVG